VAYNVFEVNVTNSCWWASISSDAFSMSKKLVLD
jgi:hypothetical protein